MAKIVYYEDVFGVHLGHPWRRKTICGTELDSKYLVIVPPRVTVKDVLTCAECIDIINHCKELETNGHNSGTYQGVDGAGKEP